MKKTFAILALFCLMGPLTISAQSGETRYALKLCTGIDENGDTFDGSQCKDELSNGPCDKESVCYESESIAPEF